MLRFYSVIDLDCNMSTSKVNDIIYLVVIIQKNSVQCADFHFSSMKRYLNDNIQNSENFYMTLTFDLDLTLSLTFDLDDLIKYIFFNFLEVTWRTNVTSIVISETTHPIGIFSWKILQSTRSFYDFRFHSYSSKGDFHGDCYVWPWPWHFKVIWFLWIRHLFPCMNGVHFEAICTLIAEI